MHRSSFVLLKRPACELAAEEYADVNGGHGMEIQCGDVVAAAVEVERGVCVGDAAAAAAAVAAAAAGAVADFAAVEGVCKLRHRRSTAHCCL